MDILEKARQHFPLETTGQPFQTHELQRIKVVREMADEIERLREALQKIADIEHEDIPAPRTPNEGTTWTVLAMAVGLAEKALKGDE